MFFSSHDHYPTTGGLKGLMRGGTAPTVSSIHRPSSRQTARGGAGGVPPPVAAPGAAGLPTSPVGKAIHPSNGRKPTAYSSSTGAVNSGNKLGVTSSSRGRKAAVGGPKVSSAAPGRAAVTRPPPAHIVFEAPLSPQGRKTRAIHEALRCIHLSPSHRTSSGVAEDAAVVHSGSKTAARPSSPIMLVTAGMTRGSVSNRVNGGSRLQSAKGPNKGGSCSKLTDEKKKRNKSASAASRRKRDEVGLREEEMRSFLRLDDPLLAYDGVYEDDGDRRFGPSPSDMNLFTSHHQTQPQAAASAAKTALFFNSQKQDGQQISRPPSRQKDAFPVHLADLGDLLPPKKRKDAFQVEVNVATQQHIETTRKTASENPRPPSRHKPPSTALFLEVPPCDIEATPSFSDELTPIAAWPVGRKQAVIDNRTDDPERDGFTLLDDDGTPCPFKIEVTTELDSDEDSDLASHTQQQQSPSTLLSGSSAAITTTSSPTTTTATEGPVTAPLASAPFAALFEPSSVFAQLTVDTSPATTANSSKRPGFAKGVASNRSPSDPSPHSAATSTVAETPSPIYVCPSPVTPLLGLPSTISAAGSGPTASSTSSSSSSSSHISRSSSRNSSSSSDSCSPRRSPEAMISLLLCAPPTSYPPTTLGATNALEGGGGAITIVASGSSSISNQAPEVEEEVAGVEEERDEARAPEWAKASSSSTTSSSWITSDYYHSSNRCGTSTSRRKQQQQQAVGHHHHDDDAMGQEGGLGVSLPWGGSSSWRRMSEATTAPVGIASSGASGGALGGGGVTAGGGGRGAGGGAAVGGGPLCWGQWSLDSNLGEEFLSLFAPQHEEDSTNRTTTTTTSHDNCGEGRPVLAI